MYGPLDAGLLLLIQQGQLGNAQANHAQTTLATPVVHLLVKMMDHVRLKPERGGFRLAVLYGGANMFASSHQQYRSDAEGSLSKPAPDRTYSEDVVGARS